MVRRTAPLLLAFAVLSISLLYMDESLPRAAAQLGAFGATRAPAIDVDANDKLYLLMSVATSRTGGPHSQIFFAQSDDGGVNWDNLPRTRNLSMSEGEAFGPSVAVNRFGKVRVYVVYQDNSTGSTQAYLVRSKKRAKFRLPVNITPGIGGAFSPRVALDSTEAINVVWGDTTGGTRKIAFVRSEDLGFTFAPKITVSKSAGFAFEPAVAVDANDDLHVVWQDTGPGNSVIMHSRSLDGGGTFSEPRQISTGTGEATEAVIAIDGGGGISVVWIQVIGDGREVMFSRSTDSGSTFSAPLPVTNTSGANLSKPAIAVSRQTIYVTFQEQTRNSGQVFLAKSEDLGAAFSPPVQISNAMRESGRGHSPAMVADSRGRVHIVWIDNSIIGNDEGLLMYSNTRDGQNFTEQRMILAGL